MGGTQNASFHFHGLECAGCQRVGGGGFEQKSYVGPAEV